MKNSFVLAMLVPMVLSACASNQHNFAPVTGQADERYKKMDLETERMLKSIEQSLLVLAETRSGQLALTEKPEEMRAREWLYRVVPAGMGVPMTINNFRGHPEVLVDMVANMTDYTIERIGEPAPDTRNVSVSVISRPAVEVLRSVAAQMACDGLVDVQGANRKIVLDWTVRKRGECK